MKITKILALAAVTCFLPSCLTTSKPKNVMTPLEIQYIQSREYDVSKDIAFRSVISVFQDIGYIIKKADLHSGFISAESSSTSKSNWLHMKHKNGSTVVRQTKATAFVEKIGNKSKIRLSFVNIKKTSYSKGQKSRSDKPILDASLYQNAFEKVENAIFLRKQS